MYISHASTRGREISPTEEFLEEEMEKKVLAAMKKAGKPVRPADIAKIIHEDSKDVSKTLDALKKAGKIKSPKRCFYEPC
jgi:hypothetical protein